MIASEARRLHVGREDDRSKRWGERHLHVIVIGAGFSGLSVASRLLEGGEKDFVVLERGEGVGGVWRDNTYPGAVCDVPSHLYSLSFAPNPEWDRAFSPGAQIKDYLESVVRDRGLGPWISLREELLDAAWDDNAEAWSIVTTRRRLSADVLVSCAGPLTEPVFPNVPGLDIFRGKTFHTSRWDDEHDLAGQRVAVVGTGASAVQVVPEIQPRVGRLLVFQRTPGWVVPRPDRKISEMEKRILRAFPRLVRLYRLRQAAHRDLVNYRMIRRNRLARRLLEGLSRRLLEEQVGDQEVGDQELRAKLTPDYEIGCKRVLLANDFY